MFYASMETKLNIKRKKSKQNKLDFGKCKKSIKIKKNTMNFQILTELKTEISFFACSHINETSCNYYSSKNVQKGNC